MPYGGGKRMRAPVGRTCPPRKGVKLMFKAKLFNFRDSQTYFKKYGISPDKHFDRLREKYGTDTAVNMIDENMMKAWKSKWKEEEKQKEREQRILETECPFE